MKFLSVKSLRGITRIAVGRGLLKKMGALLQALGLEGKVMALSQERVAGLYLGRIQKSISEKKFKTHVHLLPEGEAAKSEKELSRLYHAFVREDMERGDAVIALGGGTVGDVAGFAAATYLRGVPFINVGTTLLAQVDSSIGGKTGINLDEGKNLVGAFYPPRLVVSDVETLTSLPERQLRASMAEVIKYGVIRDAGLFHLLEKQSARVLQKDLRLLEKIVERSARLKAAVVGRDELETKGERMILNFGHTFGHGFEKALDFHKLAHGEAVAIGMAAAARLATHLKIFDRSEAQRLTDLLRKYRLPVTLAGLGLETRSILEAMKRDKKKTGGRLRFVLPVKIGKVAIREDVPAKLVEKVIEELRA